MQEQMYRFQSDVTYDAATLKEVNRSYSQFHPRSYISKIIIFAVICYYIGFVYIWQKSYTFYSRFFLIIAVVYWGIQLVTALLNRNGGIHYKRMLSNNSGQPVRQTISFDDTGIYCLNLDSKNINTFRFEQLRSIAQTKNHLILMLEYNQFILVSKDRLTGGSQEEFTNYLIPLCPKLKPKKIRSNKPGQIIHAAMLILWIIGFVLAVYRLPFVQQFVENSRAINNAMSCQEIANELEPLGIYIDDASIAEIDEFYSSLQDDPYYADYYMEYSKVTDLLCCAGWGTYDEESWEWTPSTSGVYWFDAEIWNLETMYSDFLRGVSALNSEELNFANIQEDTSNVDWESGSGTQTVTFDWNGQSYYIEGHVQNDWFDMQAANNLSEIIQSQTDKQLYFAYDGGQGYLVFYGTKQWAKDFEHATGLDLQPKVSSLWY